MATNPMYSSHLQFAPTFRWGGREWGAADRAAFERYLRRRGVKPAQWYRRHRTAAKVFDPTEQQIYGMFQPQITGIEAERKRTAEQWKQRMASLQGFTQALMPYLQKVPGAIQGPYNAGGAGLISAGQFLGSGLNVDTAASAAGANAVLSSIGAPEGQQLSGGDAGGVVAGMGGLEGELMQTQGGAFGAAATQLPKTASLEATLLMKQLLSGAEEEDKGFSEDILAVLQGLPAARAGFRDQATEDRLAMQKQRLAELKFEADQHYKNAMLALYTGDRKRYAREMKLAQQKENRYAMESRGLSPDGTPLPGFHLDPTGGVVKDGWHINPKTGVPVKDKTPGKGGGKGGTYEERHPGAADVKTVSQHQDDIDRYIKNMGHEANPAEAVKHGVPPFTVIYPDWDTAYKRLWGRFKNTVSTPKGRKALDQAIRAALSAAGIKKSSTNRPQPGPK